MSFFRESKAVLASTIIFFEDITELELLRIKVTPDLHLTYSKNGGNLGLVLKMNEKYSLYINFIDKTCKTYLFKFVLYSIVAFKAN